jgi:hypothetical protein
MFDEQPDGDPHGECAAEIHRLKSENDSMRSALRDLLSVRDQFAKAALPQFLELEVTGVWNQGLPDAVSKRDHAQQVARAAYRLADAMMAERGTSGVPVTHMPLSQDQQTQDQAAAVMLLHGTPKQQAEALRTCGVALPDGGER